MVPGTGRPTIGGAVKMVGHPLSLDQMDFSKPEKYVREILDFLQSVTITNDLNTQKSYKTLSGSDAQALIYTLLKQIAPNYQSPPKFEAGEIRGLFEALCYPGTIRADAISAVGAPSTIQFLMRAIYWLYQVTKVYFLEVEDHS